MTVNSFNLRAGIADDFLVVDDLESVSTSYLGKTGLLTKAKRNIRKSRNSPVEAAGRYFEDLVTWQGRFADHTLTLGIGGKIIDQNQNTFVIVAIEDSQMTGVLTYRTVALGTVLPNLVRVLKPNQNRTAYSEASDPIQAYISLQRMDMEVNASHSPRNLQLHGSYSLWVDVDTYRDKFKSLTGGTRVQDCSTGVSYSIEAVIGPDSVGAFVEIRLLEVDK